jgi:hypothetical protein
MSVRQATNGNFTVVALIIEPAGEFSGGSICRLANVRQLVQYWRTVQLHRCNCISAGARPCEIRGTIVSVPIVRCLTCVIAAVLVLPWISCCLALLRLPSASAKPAQTTISLP